LERLLRNADTLRWQLTLIEGEPEGCDEFKEQE
jgi:hypothetical protein